MGKPVKCARCGRENDAALVSCLDCGQGLRPAPQPAACSGCGKPIQAGFRFCGNCGRPVAAGPGTPGPAPRTPAPEAPALTAPQEIVRPPPPAPDAPLRLQAVRNDGLPGAAFALPPGPIVCGRTEGELRFPDDPTVSPRHVRFTAGPRAVHAEDLGSENGTFVRLRTPRRLGVGDEIRIGRQRLRLEPLPRPASPDEEGVRAWGGRDEGCRLRLAQLLEGGGVGEIFPLRPGENAVGRDTGDVTFPSDRYVSARHARLEVRDDGVLLVDAGSSNGTFVRAAGAVELAPGDQLLVGSQLLRVEA